MKVHCPYDNEWHDMTPTMLLVVIDAFVKGDLQSVKGVEGVTVQCLLKAFTARRVSVFKRKYPGSGLDNIPTNMEKPDVSVFKRKYPGSGLDNIPTTVEGETRDIPYYG